LPAAEKYVAPLATTSSMASPMMSSPKNGAEK
jgi:hypothetical protein